MLPLKCCLNGNFNGQESCRSSSDDGWWLTAAIFRFLNPSSELRFWTIGEKWNIWWVELAVGGKNENSLSFFEDRSIFLVPTLEVLTKPPSSTSWGQLFSALRHGTTRGTNLNDKSHPFPGGVSKITSLASFASQKVSFFSSLFLLLASQEEEVVLNL